MFLEISQNSQENACFRVSFLITLQTRPAPLLTKRTWYRCFLVNFTKFLRTLFLKNTSRRRLLDIWNPWDWKYIICVFKFYRQKWRNSTWKFYLSRARSLHRINVSVFLSVQYICIKRIWGLRPAILLKERLWHRCFPVNFAKFFKIPFI